MNLPANAFFLVFSDLDGSLLDHHSYSYLDAVSQLRRLEQLNVPVILATSKTRSEVEKLRHEMGNACPFIVENGAAIFIPVGYFDLQPEDTIERDGYWVREMSSSREQWLALLDSLLLQFPEEFDYFFRAGTEGIVRMTNLSLADALAANCREYSEPVQWLGDERRKADFVHSLQHGGATVLQGGRFLSVSGDCDKGRALLWLRRIYQQSRQDLVCHDLAIGDSANDCAMLEAAENALLVRSPVHPFPSLERSSGLIFSHDYGPAGWAEGVARWLHTYFVSNEQL